MDRVMRGGGMDRGWTPPIFETWLGPCLVSGTAAIRRRRQSMKPQVEVKSMNHRPAADYVPSRRR